MGFSADLVVGVYFGFDDNRSLGEHETGAVAALPVFIDFMQKAYANKPKRDFNRPKDAVYMTVRGIEEAFKPGTEPQYNNAPSNDDGGPRPYTEVWQSGEETPPAAPKEEAPPETAKKPDDPANLY
jgi:penicillin-binding protein 1A